MQENHLVLVPRQTSRIQETMATFALNQSIRIKKLHGRPKWQTRGHNGIRDEGYGANKY